MALTNSKVIEVIESVEDFGTPEPELKIVRGKKTEANELMLSEGNAILDGMGKATKLVGSLSHTLHFVTLLGLGSKRSVRRTGEGNVDCPSTIGVTLTSDRPIKVPVIHVLKNKDTGVETKDISFRRIVRGREFHLNMYELMFLMVRTEYAGFMTHNGDPQGVYFSPKMSNYHRGEALLPTPTLSFKNGLGSIKQGMFQIDYKDENGVWKIKESYLKEFGSLITVKEVKKEKEEKVSYPAPTAVALALGHLLGEKYGFKV
jgi:hypothetical protein